MTLISVVVPIYNVDKYLRRCVDSIFRQTYREIEILLIDDGSTDGSGKLCDQLDIEDSRVRVFHKINGGLSSARNEGIANANGEYICFIDADDMIAEYYVEDLLEACKKNSADIAVGRYELFSDSTLLFQKLKKQSMEVYTGKDAVWLMFGNDYVNYVVACNKLYKIELFNNIRYPEGKNNEDEATTYKLFYKSGKVAVTNEIIYGYYQRRGSITKSAFTMKKMEYLSIAKQRAKYFQDMDEPNLADAFNFLYAISLLDYRIKLKRAFNDKKLESELMTDFKLISKKLRKSRYLSKKRRIVLIILSWFPFIYNIYQKIIFKDYK